MALLPHLTIYCGGVFPVIFLGQSSIEVDTAFFFFCLLFSELYFGNHKSQQRVLCFQVVFEVSNSCCLFIHSLCPRLRISMSIRSYFILVSKEH